MSVLLFENFTCTRRLLSLAWSFILYRMPFYAVGKGRNPGIYETWAECEKEVKKFPGARHKKFATLQEAHEFVKEHRELQTHVQSYCAAYAVSGNHFTNRSWGDRSHAPPLSSVGDNIQTSFGSLKRHASALTSQSRNIHNSQPNNPSAAKKLKQSKQTAGCLNGKVKQLSQIVENSQTDESDCPVVYTDGCCYNNGQRGAVAGIGVFWGPRHPLNVSEPLQGRQTNNRAEIHAACKAVQQAKDQGYQSIEIRTDSQFMINSMTKWIKKWKYNGWKLVDGKQVINREDFEELDRISRRMVVKYVHVAGHSGIQGNEAADSLANEGAGKAMLRK